MRSSISAQSCDSVPPAPGWMVTIAFFWSCSPPSIFLVSAASTSRSSASSPSASSRSTSSPACAHSTSTDRSSSRVFSASTIWTSCSRRRRRCSIFCASAWSFQKSGCATSSSRRVSSSRGADRSKITPQLGGALRQVLVPPDEFFEHDCHHTPLSGFGPNAADAATPPAPRASPVRTRTRTRRPIAAVDRQPGQEAHVTDERGLGRTTSSWPALGRTDPRCR